MGKVFELHEIGEGKKVIYYLDYEKSCLACVDKSIFFLNEMADLIGEENIAIIIKLATHRDLKVLTTKYNIRYDAFFVKGYLESGKKEISNYFHQYLFLTNDDLLINLAIPISSLYDIGDGYHEIILKHFKGECLLNSVSNVEHRYEK